MSPVATWIVVGWLLFAAFIWGVCYIGSGRRS
jgi:hypothetical protein